MASEMAQRVAQCPGTLMNMLKDLQLPDLPLPFYLQKLLIYCGYDNYYSLATLNDNSIKQMENFAQNDLVTLLDVEEHNSFYGIYFKNPKMFKIAFGHKELLQIISNSCKNYVKEQTKIKSKITSQKRQLESGDIQKHSKRRLKVNACVRDQNNETNDDILDDTETLSLALSETSTLASIETTGTESENLSDNTSDNTHDTQKKVIQHVKCLAYTYASKYLMSMEVNGEDATEEVSIRKKSSLEKLKNLKTFMKNGQIFIECTECEFQSRPYYSNTNKTQKWVCSNFNRHFKTHFESNNKNLKKNIITKTLAKSDTRSDTNSGPKLKNSSILSFVEKIPQTVTLFTTPFTSSHFSKATSSKNTLNKIIIDEDNPRNSTEHVTIRLSSTESSTLSSDLCEDTQNKIKSNDINIMPEKSTTESTNDFRDDGVLDENIEENIEQITAFESDSSENFPHASEHASMCTPTLSPTPNEDFQSESITILENVSLDVSNTKQIDCPGSSLQVAMSTPRSTLTLAPSPRPAPTRRNRLQTSLMLTFDKTQMKITDFYNYCKKIESALETIPEIRHQLNHNINIINDRVEDGVDDQDNTKNIVAPLERRSFFEMLQRASKSNTAKSNYAHRYSEQLKKLCLYLFLTSGRLAYETLCANMENALPSLQTLYRTLTSFDTYIEGTLQFEELTEFLRKRNYPLRVFISEDQTAIVQRPRYDPRTNQLVGFVNNISTNIGFPDNTHNTVNSVQDILNKVKNGILSHNAYVFMAQPLIENAPAFCLCIFGSDNKFLARDVTRRWKYITEEAEKIGITIEGFASDGDTRCLKAMKIISNLPRPNTSELDYNSNCPYLPYFQVSS